MSKLLDDFYQRIADVYENVSIDPELLDSKGRLTSKKLIMIPVDEPYHQLGATILLSYLAFPDETEAKQRSNFVNSVNAKLIKLKFSRNSPERKNLQKFTEIRNEAIKLLLGVGRKSAGYRLNIRVRAADVMWRKLYSSDNPSNQDSLRVTAKTMAKVNTDSFPAFTHKEGVEEATDSFIKRIIWPTKPVLHLAMSSYLQNYNLDMNNEAIVPLIIEADKWLIETLFMAEMVRAEFKYLFPRSNSQNIKVNLCNTLAFFPIQSTDTSEQIIHDQIF